MKFLAWALIAAVTVGMAPVAFAAEAPAGTAPVAAPAKAVTAPVPAVKSTEGPIKALDIQSALPNLTLTGSDNKDVTIQIDKLLTTVWKGMQKLPLTDLKAGDKVKVRHTTKDGKEVAKTIEVMP
ncbi:MAG TPA: hypothetical protein PKL97_09060 [Candidatus Omnitrophota bacterium]|nr:hypothetical protein [Candidatus Omnitrophota bacterium]